MIGKICPKHSTEYRGFIAWTDTFSHTPTCWSVLSIRNLELITNVSGAEEGELYSEYGSDEFIRNHADCQHLRIYNVKDDSPNFTTTKVRISLISWLLRNPNVHQHHHDATYKFSQNQLHQGEIEGSQGG